MATQTAVDNKRAELDYLLRAWEGRWRTRRLILLLPRLLAVMLLIAIAGTVFARSTRLLRPEQLNLIIGVGLGLAIVLLIAGLRFFGREGVAAARQFDQLFHLQERVSTALEIMDGRIRTLDQIADHQLEDAYDLAKSVDARKHIKFKIRWLEWFATLPLVVILGVLLLLPSFSSNGLSDQTQQALSAAADDIRDMTEAVATNTTLSPEERESLLESLEVSLDELENPDRTAEDAFITLSELESDLREQADSLSNELAQQQESLAAAAEALGRSNALNNLPEAGSQLDQELSELQEALSSLSPEEQAALAQQLQQAAEAAEGTSSELSQALQDAAQSLQSQNPQSAESALEQAQQALQNSRNQAQQQQQTADSLQQSANQAQQAQENIAQSEQQSQGQSSPNENDSAAQENQQQAPSNNPVLDRQEGQDSQQEGSQQPAPDSGIDQSTTLSQSGQERPQEGGFESQSPNSEQAGNAEDGSSSESDASSSSAGDGEAAERQADSGQPIEQQVTTSNNPDGEGQTEFDEIFVPETIDAEGTSNLLLEPETGDQPAIEGEFQENPTGETTVPYNQVFSDYANAANRALETDYVPLGMQDVIRDYFTSLEPGN